MRNEQSFRWEGRHSDRNKQEPCGYLEPLVEKHAWLVQEFYLWAKIQDCNSTSATHENVDLGSDKKEVDHHRI